MRRQVVTLAFVIILPMPLYGTNYIFSKPFFRLWVVWTFAWAWAAGLIITILPLWQGRRTLRLVVSHMFSRDTRGSRSPGSRSNDEGIGERSSEEEDEKKIRNEDPLARVLVMPVATPHV